MGAPDAARWDTFVQALGRRLARVFLELDALLDLDAEVLEFRPAAGAWTAREVAEHVALCDRFLLILVSKIAAKSANRAATRRAPLPSPPQLELLEPLGASGFHWPHPDHMTPTGALPVPAVREQLAADLAACRTVLAELPNGEGSLHRIRMSAVPGDDRLDLYQFLAIIAVHAERHVRQMRRNAASFAEHSS